MDTSLRCNDLQCRTVLNNQAVVTTCSHVFCLPCADRLELTAPKDGQRICPACQTYLLNPDDAVVASLNPSEDYKTSILSGLSPTIIIECAGRGLQFWTYQVAQEITYQGFLAQSLKDKYKVLGAHLDGVVREANEENQRLNGKIEALQAREQGMQERIQQLEYQFKSKDQAMKKIEKMYNTAKGQLLASGIEYAADQDAEEVLQAGTQYYASQAHAPGRRVHRAGSRGSGDNDDLRPRALNQSSQYLPQGFSSQLPRGTQSSHTAPVQQTPSATRQQLPQPTFGHYNQTIHQQNAMRNPRHDSFRQGTPIGASQAGRAGTIPRNYGIGMPANAKVSRPLTQAPPFSRGNYAAVGGGRQNGY